jgi:hypothetical protein
LVDLEGGWLRPGFVDLHMHGGGGAQITTTTPPRSGRAVTFHRRHGTTRTVASIVTDRLDRMVAAITTLAAMIDAGEAGIHLEGPSSTLPSAAPITTSSCSRRIRPRGGSSLMPVAATSVSSFSRPRCPVGWSCSTRWSKLVRAPPLGTPTRRTCSARRIRQRCAAVWNVGRIGALTTYIANA